MRVLIFSDTHLTVRFEQEKYDFLKRIVSDCDQVVINGDFWDGAITTFDKFVNSDWKSLFPLLKQKNTVYVYGNHDRRENSDERVSLFSVKQTYRHILKQNNKTFIIEHGHQTQPAIFEKLDIFPHSRIFVVFLNNFFSVFEKSVIKLLGNKTLQHKLYGKLNRETKQNIKELDLRNAIYICGHTHSPEIDLKNNFINTGFIRHSIAQYIMIENGKAELKEEKYA